MEKYTNKVKNILNDLDVSENTRKSYLSHMKKIYNIAGVKGFSFKFLKDYNMIDDVIKDEKDTTRKMIYISISRVVQKQKGFKKISNIYKEKSLEITRKLNKNYCKNELSVKQKTFGKYSDLLEKLEELKENYKLKPHKTNKKKYLAGCIYIMSHFTPRLEYSDMKVIKDKDLNDGINNFMLFEDEEVFVILNKYKTVKKYGTIKYKLEEDLVERLKFLDVDDSTYVFESNKKGSYARTKFSAFLKNVFGFSVNGIRMIKENVLQNSKKYKKLSVGDREKLHNTYFQHSGLMAICAYRKLEHVELYD